MDGKRVFTAVPVLVCLVVAAILLVGWIPDFWTSRVLDDRGIEVPVRDVAWNDNAGEDDLHVKFTPRGADRSRWTWVSYDGDFLTDYGFTSDRGDPPLPRIEYDPQNPDVARVVGEHDGLEPGWLSLIVSMGLLACAVLFGYWVARWDRAPKWWKERLTS